MVVGYSPYMANQSGPQSGQSRPPSGMNSSNQFYGFPPASNLRGTLIVTHLPPHTVPSQSS